MPAVWLQAKFFPAALRDDFLALRQLHHELFRAALSTREARLASAKLGFWREAVADLFRGRVSQDPLSLCLSHALGRHELPPALFLKMVDARLAQTENPTPRSVPQMLAAAQETHVPFLLLTLRLLRVPVLDSPALLEVVEAVAAAMGIAEALQTVPFDLRSEVLRLPADVCAKHGLSVASLWDRQGGAPSPDLFDATLE